MQRSVRLVMQRLQSYAGLPPPARLWGEFWTLLECAVTNHGHLGLQEIIPTDAELAAALARAEEWQKELSDATPSDPDAVYTFPPNKASDEGNPGTSPDLKGWYNLPRALQHAGEGVEICKKLIVLRQPLLDAMTEDVFRVG